jgi:hypothetical protein
MLSAPLNAAGKPAVIGKGLFHCMLFSWEMQTDNLVRWDVAERLNRKQKQQKSETQWHTNTSPTNGLNPKKASSKI